MSGVNEIRSAFSTILRSNGHEVVASSPLVPRNDPTLMFTNAGMVQFKNVFTGLEKRPYTRAATAQKCVRAGGKHNDLDNVGYTARHHTFFEMLGNFSFGDYFKERAIELAWNLITKDFGLPKDRLLVTVYHRRRRGLRLWKKIAGLPDDQDHPHRRLRQFLGDGRHRPVRPVLGNLLSTTATRSRAARPGQPGRGRRPLHRDLEPRLHAVRAAAGRQARRRCRSPRSTPAWGSSASPRCCRASHDNYDTDLFRAPDRRDRAMLGRGPAERPAQGVAPRHRRSSARLVLPDRRRRAALERGPRLRAAPDHAPRHAPRPAARRQGAADVEAGAGAGARDGAGLSGTACAPRR